VRVKPRVAIVVQRCHESVVGGSESLAWQYAQLLRDAFEVEVLTSTAVDYLRWRNALPEGVALRDGIPVRRFRVEIERERYWFELHRRLVHTHAASEGLPASERIPWRPALQDEFVRFQGPYCSGLTAHLVANHAQYDAVLFCTYLYPTTHFAVTAVPRAKRIFVPTLHDEPTAYLSTYAERAHEFDHVVWLTRSEREVARRLWDRDDGVVIGMAVDHTEAVRATRWRRPYFLYSGRIEQGKGAHDLISAFAAFRRRSGARVDLLLTGAKSMHLPWWRRDVRFLGFVDEQRKLELMAGALAFVLPSAYESFSIVTMEAMAQRTPVVLNGACTVLAEHVTRSGGGVTYHGVEGLVAAMEAMTRLSVDERERYGAAGRDYVRANYEPARVRAALVEYVTEVVNRAATSTASTRP